MVIRNASSCFTQSRKAIPESFHIIRTDLAATVRKSVQRIAAWSGVILFFGISQAQGATAVNEPSVFRLGAIWNAAGSSKTLPSMSLDELKKMKKVSSKEKDPESGKILQLEGPRLSIIVDKMLAELPIEQKAQVDLVTLKSASGKKALIPRGLINKYPIYLAYSQKGFGAERAVASKKEGLVSVIPWTSKPKILTEELPLETYFLSDVTEIELTNYRDQYPSLYLQRRTNPRAMRGEKFFVQNCANCHAVGAGAIRFEAKDAEKMKRFAAQGHPQIPVSIKFSTTERDWILTYFESRREENSLPGQEKKASAEGSVSRFAGFFTNSDQKPSENQ